MGNADKSMTWEQTVEMFRKDPEKRRLLYFCYLDDPLIIAARRFADSEEWRSVRKILPKTAGKALDIGAGRGISSYALALDGWDVTALEPDGSQIVGAGAIRRLAAEDGLKINVIEQYGEKLPFDDNTFDVVYLRQVLHHASDMPLFIREVRRVLRPRGLFIATREHVITRQSDLGRFLETHDTNKYHGGENAYTLGDYKSAFAQGGLKLVKVLGPMDSPINYYPMTHEEWRLTCSWPVSAILGKKIAGKIWNERHLPGLFLLRTTSTIRSKLNNRPGRMFSFVLQKL